MEGEISQERGPGLGSAVFLCREPTPGLAGVDTFQPASLQHSHRPACSDSILVITLYCGNLSGLQVY
jgi:hypothetical protein